MTKLRYRIKVIFSRSQSYLLSVCGVWQQVRLMWEILFYLGSRSLADQSEAQEVSLWPSCPIFKRISRWPHIYYPHLGLSMESCGLCLGTPLMMNWLRCTAPLFLCSLAKWSGWSVGKDEWKEQKWPQIQRQLRVVMRIPYTSPSPASTPPFQLGRAPDSEKRQWKTLYGGVTTGILPYLALLALNDKSKVVWVWVGMCLVPRTRQQLMSQHLAYPLIY